MKPVTANISDPRGNTRGANSRAAMAPSKPPTISEMDLVVIHAMRAHGPSRHVGPACPWRSQGAPVAECSNECLGRLPIQETAYTCSHSIGALFLQKVASLRYPVHGGIGEVTVPPCNGFFIAKG